MRLLICLDRLILGDDFSIDELAVKKIKAWLEAGVDIEYITNKNKFLDLKKVDDALKENDIDDAKVHKKQESEKFQAVIEHVNPNLFIDCANGLEDGVSISDKLKKDYKLKKIIINSIEELVKLPTLPDELKDYAKAQDSEE